MNDEKEVYFDQYCKSCKHRGLKTRVTTVSQNPAIQIPTNR